MVFKSKDGNFQNIQNIPATFFRHFQTIPIQNFQNIQISIFSQGIYREFPVFTKYGVSCQITVSCQIWKKFSLPSFPINSFFGIGN